MTEEYKCTFTSEEEGSCDAGASLYGNLPLCEEHTEVIRTRNQLRFGYQAKVALDHHRYADFGGLCYIVLVPGGDVKIGYSNTPELLRKRMSTLRRKLGPVITLATIPGGMVTEAYLHRCFRKFRRKGTGELFEYAPEIAQFVDGIREDPEYRPE